MKGLMMHYPLTTHSIIEYASRVFPEKQIITRLPDGSRHQYLFADLYRRAKQLTHGLIHTLGVKPGDKVATFAWNHYQHLELYYGIPGAGAICHTLNIRLSAEQIQYIVNHGEDTVIFVDASLVRLIEKIQPLLPLVRHYVVINAGKDFSTTLPDFMLYEDLVAGDPSDEPWYPSEEEDACALCYTSGTTANPKGVLYSHRSTYLHALASITPNAGNISAMEKVLIIVPQFHAMAWGAPFSCLLAGADIVMPSSHLQPEPLVEIMEKEEVTKALGIPTIWIGVLEALRKHPERKLVLREFWCGGSALPPILIEAYEKEFGVCAAHAWGMTETSPIGTFSRLQRHHQSLPEDAKNRIRAKQGIELPATEIQLLKDDGMYAPRDGKTTGEILIRGPWITGGYFKMEERSAYFTEDGWFRTGDVGTIDPDGYLEISDRTKDLIKSGGEWISSVALEVALMAHPDIREACVIATPHPTWVERPLACVVFVEGKLAAEEELRKFLLQSFASYQVPDRFVPLKEIPKTSVGKFNKKELRRMLAAGELPVS